MPKPAATVAPVAEENAAPNHKKRCPGTLQYRDIALFSAVYQNGLADKFRRTRTMPVDVGPETVIGHIHLPQACQDLGSTVVVMGADVVLQLPHQPLSLCRCRGGTVSHAGPEFSHDPIHFTGQLIPLAFAVMLGFLPMLFVCIGVAPALLRLGLVLVLLA